MKTKYVMTLFSISSSLFFSHSVLAQATEQSREDIVTSDSSYKDESTSTTQEETLSNAESSFLFMEPIDTTKELSDQDFIEDTANISSNEEEFTSNEIKDVPFLIKDWEIEETKDTVTLLKYIGNEKQITIPSSYHGKQVQVKNLQIPTFVEQFSLRVVNEGEKVKAINQGISFAGNEQLKYLDLQALDTSQLLSLNSMFENCISLREVNVSGWNTTKVKSVRKVFRNTKQLQRLIGYEKWEFPEAENFYQMFSGSDTLEQLDVSQWKEKNTVNKVIFTEAFANMENLKSLTISGWKGDCYVLNRFCQENNQLEEVKLNHWQVKNIETANRWFYQDKNLKKVELNHWGKVNIQEIEEGWMDCSSLEEINTDQEWLIQKNLNRLFMNCVSLYKLPNFHIGENVVELISVFQNAESISEIDVSNWNMSQIKDISKLFMGASSLHTIIGLENWTLSKTKRMNQTFKDCTQLKSIDLSKAKFNVLEEAKETFMNAIHLRELNLQNWQNKKLQVYENFLFGNYELSLLNLGSWNISSNEKLSFLHELKLFENNQPLLLILDGSSISEQDLLNLGFHTPGPISNGSKKEKYFPSMILSKNSWEEKGIIDKLYKWTSDQWSQLLKDADEITFIQNKLRSYKYVTDYFKEIIQVSKQGRIEKDSSSLITDEKFYDFSKGINFSGKLNSQGAQKFPRTSGGEPRLIVESRRGKSWDISAKLKVNNGTNLTGVSVFLGNDNRFRFNDRPTSFKEVLSSGTINEDYVVTKDEGNVIEARTVNEEGYYAFPMPNIALHFSEVRRAPVMKSKIWLEWNLKKVPEGQ